MPVAGDLIGPYRLVSELGKGAMGEVWRARDERLDRYVALKVLPAELARDLERRARVLREARAAAAIRHPNVVTLFDIVEHHGDDILVMELVEGRTLSETLRKDGAPTLEVGLRWIEGIADALVAAHARGILHRDIKAANIMVTAEGGIKVLDFGLAKLRDGTAPAAKAPVAAPDRHFALDETMPSEPKTVRGKVMPDHVALDATAGADPSSYQTQAGSLIGTPLYMSPEQIDGSPPDERSEVFSVGVLAHEILAGKPPYTATSMSALFKQIKDDTPPTLDQVPASIATTITKALEKNPAERIPTMAALRDAIALDRRRLFAPRARRWPLAVAALVLAGGAGAAVLWPRSSPDPVTVAEPAPTAVPGDDYVARALQEYDVFYNDKALSSLRAAIAVAPEHPLANAYLLLFGGASDSDRAAAVLAAQHARRQAPEHSKTRALLEAASALIEHGASAARTALTAAGAPPDRELAFWTA
ncbi:MAG: serine/threonine protein kinase, partial [Myxococcales bacterium]|nr:serine/threonine protein kinase [Myxococcales bacterium]